jgi:gp16 family phage-associated protein
MKKKYQNPISQKFYEAGINMTGWARRHGIPKFYVTQLANGQAKGTRGKSKKVVELLKSEGLWAENTDNKAA